MRSVPSIPFLLDLLRMAMRRQASAIYIVPWMPPTLRIGEQTVPLSSVSFSPEQTSILVLDMLDEARRATLDRSRDVQFSFVLDAVGRFQVHAFRHHGQPAMAIRPFSIDRPTPRTLALPAVACGAVLAGQGLLVLASRSGALARDATAALVEHRNHNGRGEIALLDGATRHWHEAARCQLRQGLSIGAVQELLQRRAPALPDGAPHPLAIVWGELYDGQQLERALRAAEHALCLITLQADTLVGALQALLALADEPPAADRRHRMAIALNGVLSLRPVAAADGERTLAATDALMTSPELAASLDDGDLDALRALVAAPTARGSTGADEHLWQLLTQGLVTAEAAQRCATDREAFGRRTIATHPGTTTAAAAPVTVDTGFDDLFDAGARAVDAFEFADAPPPARRPDTLFEGVDWASGVPLPHAADAAGVEFHAWAPPALVPGRRVAIDLWAALPEQAAAVAQRARDTHDEVDDEERVPDDDAAVVTLQMRIDGILDAPPTLRLRWRGKPARARLALQVPERAQAGAHAARVTLSVDGLPIGELSFVLNVMPNARPDAALEDAHAVRRMLHSAYAAYAPEERDAVLSWVRRVHRVAPGLEVFVDAPRLRSGEQWRERIEREVGRRERLFLFWSRAAAESPWVDIEWRLALRRHGPGAIDTLLLEPPAVAPLPAELADLAPVQARVREAGTAP